MVNVYQVVVVVCVSRKEVLQYLITIMATVVQQVAFLSHIPGFDPELCMFSLCLYGFPQGFPPTSQKHACCSKLPQSVNLYAQVFYTGCIPKMTGFPSVLQIH